MARVTWSGAISFGLVHIPVSLYPASRDEGVHFEWLDRKTLDPVGYKRYNKRTGKELKSQDIVKGVKQQNGEYVVLSEEEIRAALPRSTQTIDIECFIEAAELPQMVLESPYYLEPAEKSERVYALLREAMRAAEVTAIARIVMHAKEHLAALYVSGPALVLNTVRWTHAMRPVEDLKLPGQGSATPTLKSSELKMAGQLILSMRKKWLGEEYSDHFAGAVEQLVGRKVAAGEAKAVEPLEVSAPARSSNVLDLTALLADSLKQGQGRAREGKRVAGPRRRKRA